MTRISAIIRQYFATPNSKFWAGVVVFLFVNLIWELLNDVPPVWDMAYHQHQGWLYLQAWQEGHFIESFASLSPQYPPLYYLIEAFILGWTSGTQFLALLSNIPAVVVMAYCSYRLASYYVPSKWAVWAGLAPLMLPEVVWVSRESLLDFTLAACVTAAAFLVLKSRLFQSFGWTFVLGLFAVAGVMTKWVFPVYLVVVVGLAVWKSPSRQKAIRNITIVALLCLPLVLAYYGPNLSELISRYPTTNQTGLIPWKPYPRHGEPGLNNLLGWIYYPRVLASYFLQLPLLVFFVIGLGHSRGVKDSTKERPVWLLWAWMLGCIVLLTLVSPKDPRFVVPLATPLVLLIFYFWRDRPSVLKLALWILAIQFLFVSFYPSSPVKVALFERKGDRDFQTIQQEWVLFQTHYFDVAGPPRVEMWPYEGILDVIPENASAGLLPDLPRFHVEGLRLKATERGRTLRVYRIGGLEGWLEILLRLDYVVSKTGYQGISFITGFNQEIMQALNEQNWVSIASYGLPDGTRATVWSSPER